MRERKQEEAITITLTITITITRAQRGSKRKLEVSGFRIQVSEGFRGGQEVSEGFREEAR